MPKQQRGMALVIAIWVLSLLSLMAGSFALSMRRESSVASALKNNAQARALTETGLTLANYRLNQSDPTLRWLADGTPYQIVKSDGSIIRMRITSEAGKIDINTAKESYLSAVLKTVSNDSWEQQHLLNCILDWRDEDNEHRPHGAEKKQYQEAGLAYGPANRAFQNLEELQLVLGIEPEIYQQMQTWLTVYSGQADVKLEEATPEVLQIISNELGDNNIQNQALQRLQGNKSETPTQSSPADQNGQLNADDGQNGQNGNQIYTIEVEAIMESGATASLAAVVKLSAPEQSSGVRQVLDWKQDQLQVSLFADTMESRLITIQDEFTIDN
ncbi:general secretion pathway protein GspK [Methylomonas paludis]|nr:type II secretion system protein GspK [Methylomonas paludis]